MPRPRPDDEKRRAMRDVGLYTTLPIIIGVGPALGWWLGHLAQKRWGGAPWLEVGGALFGLAAAARQVYKVVRQGSRDG
ncbi:MAG TPA: AtpZ/AtpI family protein [Candidatus Krumholzibacteria bacterium]|nr:AtpZ/AtpI family protein [Candidatus Krumholzibacteria bacterium]HPD73025.1 AtpZ/AtpI family protein [Candidatus Krumholzibacteria bacterium]HRY41824.1 AtpZ/AtpI family protein [Candidatus Krumholzibacteria bacterium]